MRKIALFLCLAPVLVACARTTAPTALSSPTKTVMGVGIPSPTGVPTAAPTAPAPTPILPSGVTSTFVIQPSGDKYKVQAWWTIPHRQ